MVHHTIRLLRVRVSHNIGVIVLRILHRQTYRTSSQANWFTTGFAKLSRCWADMPSLTDGSGDGTSFSFISGILLGWFEICWSLQVSWFQKSVCTVPELFGPLAKDKGGIQSREVPNDSRFRPSGQNVSRSIIHGSLGTHWVRRPGPVSWLIGFRGTQRESSRPSADYRWRLAFGHGIWASSPVSSRLSIRTQRHRWLQLEAACVPFHSISLVHLQQTAVQEREPICSVISSTVIMSFKLEAQLERSTGVYNQPPFTTITTCSLQSTTHL